MQSREEVDKGHQQSFKTGQLAEQRYISRGIFEAHQKKYRNKVSNG